MVRYFPAMQGFGNDEVPDPKVIILRLFWASLLDLTEVKSEAVRAVVRGLYPFNNKKNAVSNWCSFEVCELVFKEAERFEPLF